MKSFTSVLVMTAFSGLAMFLGGCATAPPSDQGRDNLVDESNSTLSKMESTDSGLASFVSNGYAYAIFPDVGKGGLIAGGAFGRGIVYEQSKMIGYSSLSQATVGLQAGGQTYDELIVFENKASLDRFTNGEYTFSANASAIALKSGAAGAARYSDGVAIFVKPTGGLMAEAAIGGQKFKFEQR